jgi:glutamate 5-kinase
MTMSEESIRGALSNARTIVLKVGSALLSDPSSGLAHDLMAQWCAEIDELMSAGKRVLLVTSGAVAEGISRLGLQQRPESIHELQAAAAVGQMGLVQAYEQAFSAHERHTAMVLLTHDDLADRQRYLNARATLTTLLDFNVIPVINENDSVVTDEIRFGDNDLLAALVTNLLQAELLIVLTDTDGLFEADPAVVADACFVSFAAASEAKLDTMVAGSGRLGRGGMISKLQAARLAARGGANTVIANGRTAHVLQRIVEGENLGTLLSADLSPLAARKRWIAGQLKAKGELELDAGAVRALIHSGVSLLPVGVVRVTGQFSRGELVRCLDLQGKLIAQGLANYSSEETQKVLGVASSDIIGRLGYSLEAELIHRDNLVVMKSG